MADIVNFSASRKKKQSTQVKKQETTSDFSSFFFYVGESSVHIGKALFDDLLPYMKENKEMLVQTACYQYLTRFEQGLTDGVGSGMSQLDESLALYGVREWLITSGSAFIDLLDDFYEVDKLLDEEQTVKLVGIFFPIAFYQKYPMFSLRELTNKNWISVDASFASYLGNNKEALDATYSPKTEQQSRDKFLKLAGFNFISKEDK